MAEHRSMTGFGQAKLSGETCSYEVEVRSVNHRYLELSVKLPRSLASLEFDIRSLVAARIRRGKVDVSVTRRPVAQGVQQGLFDQGVFDGYLEVYRRLLEAHGLAFDGVKETVILDILKRAEVFSSYEEAMDVDQEKSMILPLIEEALLQLSAMRTAEGAALAQDIQSRLGVLRDLHCRIGEAGRDLPARFKERILSRVRRLEPELQLDESRLALEVVVYSDRADVTEELVRLESHFGQFAETMEREGQGRKLDFISQEFLREFNTIASKAQDAAVQALVVEAKTEIEKMKEQLQNLE